MRTTTIILAAALAFALSAPTAGAFTQDCMAQNERATTLRKHENSHHSKKKRRGRKKYVVTDFDVLYGGKKLEGASAMTFKVLGDGFVKDDFDDYYKG